MKTPKPSPSKAWLERKPFEFRWSYPIATPREIKHKARKLEVIVLGDDGKRLRDERGKTVKRTVRVKGYTQTVLA